MDEEHREGSTYYKPSVGDLRFRNAVLNSKPNPFDEAFLLRKVSDTYLSVLISDNSGERSAGYRALLEAELTRRGLVAAARANVISGMALAVSVLAIATAVLAFALGK